MSDEHLADCYPDRYPRHQEPSPRSPFRGSPGRIRAARWALGTWLGYDAFRDTRAGAFTRLRARWSLGKLRWDCIPWRGGGRYLQAKPRYYLWSLGHWLRDRRRDRLARVCEWRPVYGVLKLLLEVTLPVVCWARLGEVIRVGVVPRERAQ